MSESTPTERTPLIEDEERGARLEAQASSADVDSAGKPTPLPWRPLLILFLLNLAQPLAFELIFPFVNQMIYEIGVVDDPTKVGYYSGLIESVFALTSFCAIMPLSFVSDHYGRKPVILWGILGLSVSVMLFGLSKTFWLMVVTRCIGGTMGGVWSAFRVMTGELTDKSNQGVAFSGLVASFRIGQVIAHPLGGWLAHPERRWAIFRSHFWLNYPFSLPCFISAGIGVIAVLLGYFNLAETLPSKRKGKTTINNIPEDSQPVGQQDVTAQRSRLSFQQTLTPYVLSVFISNMAMALTSEMLFAVYPLFAFTAVDDGGLGVSEAVIGTHTAIRSAFIIMSMLAYPAFEKRMSTFTLYKISMFTWPLAILCFPALNEMARMGLHSTYLFNGILLLFFVLWALASLSWATQGIMINDISPSPEALSTINSLSGMSIALPQTLAPWLGTAFFAFSIDLDFAKGGLIWIAMISYGVLTALHSLTLHPRRISWREIKRKSSDHATEP